MPHSTLPFEQLIPPPSEVNDTHNNRTVAIVIMILGIVTSLVVFARLGQKVASSSIGRDDYAIVPALLLYLGWTGMAVYFNIHAGYGKSIDEITYGESVLFFKSVIIAAWMYPIMSASIRICILLFYHRLFAKADPKYRATIWILVSLQGVYVVIFEILPGFSCHPIQDAWNPMNRYKSCTMLLMDGTEALYIISLAFDVILLVFPVSIVWGLHLPVKRRISASVIFVLGSCAPVAAAYKLVIFIQHSRLFLSTDPHWADYQASFYMPLGYNRYGKIFWIPTQVEPSVALIGTSIPALLRIYSAALLQLSELRSAVASSFKSNGSFDK